MHSFLGRVRSKTEFPSPPLGLNTMPCLPLAPRSLGFVGYWVNLVFLRIIPLLFMLIIPVLFKSPLILSSMSIRNISKSIVISALNFHISTEDQTTDIFNKALFWHRHQFLVEKLMLLDLLASI